MRERVRRLLAWGVLLSVLLPMVIAVVLGLGALLASLGDKAGGVACGRANQDQKSVDQTLWAASPAAEPIKIKSL